MFDWVPLYNYNNYFELLVLILILLALWQCQVGAILKKDIASMNATWGFFIAIFIILYMGLRPISGVFGDTMNYAHQFEEMVRDNTPFTLVLSNEEGEFIFYNLMRWCAKYSNMHVFLFINAFLYVGTLWLACVRIFKNYYYVTFLVIIGMFTFWTYGVNGIRNGVGASLFILAMTYVNNIPAMLFIAFLGLGFHNSVALMIAAAALAWFFKNSYYYLAGWVACVITSYAIGGRIQAFLSNLSFMQADERFSGYLTGSNMAGELVQMSMTFRWDFILYSTIGVFVGYYFIFRRNFKDEYYHWIYNTYLACNAFWVLVIRAAYSNRFAQISWFILPLVLIYPFMKKRFWNNHEKMLGYAIIVFYAFSFYTNIIKPRVFSSLF